MRRARMKTRWLWLSVALVAASCSDEKPPPQAEPLYACVEQPTGLQRPPEGQLPCELLPPEFAKLNLPD